ncbi:MAG: alkaline phosphatase family protein, partial [Candidatus Tumulicola sp.]
MSSHPLVSALAGAAFAVGLASCSGGGGGELTPSRHATSISPDALSTKYIKHIVIVVQENRSFDNFFATFPGADGATYGYNHDGKQIPLKKQGLRANDINHGWETYLTECDLQGSTCKMDGFDLVQFNGNQPAGNYPYQYVDPAQIQPYWILAQQYVLADHMFQTQGSGSFTAHQDLIAGGTAIDATASLVDYPSSSRSWGCDSLPGTVTSLITVNDVYEKGAGPFPCLNYPSGTMRDLLDAKHVTWKYYAPPYTYDTVGALWNAFAVVDAVRHGPEWSTNISTPETNVFNDIRLGRLPTLSWVIPERANSDHPRKAGSDDGPSWVAAVVNAIGTSPYWKSTAVVIVWDDWGGFFDHVAPKQYGSGELGFRVPALIVSPYVGAGKVSHTNYEFGSILKFVERTFLLGSLGTTDVRAASIGDVFQFKKPARNFVPI